MIANISDRKDTSFLSIDKVLSNEIKFSLLKMVFSCIFEQHFHEVSRLMHRAEHINKIVFHDEKADFIVMWFFDEFLGWANSCEFQKVCLPLPPRLNFKYNFCSFHRRKKIGGMGALS